MDKKKIDDLFHEKFRDFDEIPDEKVWKTVASTLDKKKKSRKILPIWWRLSGAAAILAIALYLINPFGDSSKEVETITTSDESNSPDTVKEKNGLNKNGLLKEKSSVPDEGAIEITDAENNPSKVHKVDGPNTLKEQTVNPQLPLGKETNRHSVLEQNTANKNGPVTSSGKMENPKIPIDDLSTKHKNEGGIAGVAPDLSHIANEGQKEGSIEVKSTTPKPSAHKEPYGTEAIAEVETKKEEDSPKKSIFDEIKKQEEEKEDLVAEKSSGKWSVGPNVAPVYFNAIGEGSPIHSNFVSNSKSGNVNLSYGLVVSYEATKKLSVRSGIHKVDYGYNTNEVEFSSSINTNVLSQSLIDHIDYSLASRNLVISSKAKTINSDFPAIANALDVLEDSPVRKGKMEQRFGYLEVPLELKYALVDSRFGVNLIGGISSLFLNNNSILLESDDLATEVGEANNLNSVNFSTNFGFGINYKFTPQLQLNIEPIFKYQLNTFSETAGSFNPFSIGVYSGINYKF